MNFETRYGRANVRLRFDIRIRVGASQPFGLRIQLGEVALNEETVAVNVGDQALRLALQRAEVWEMFLVHGERLHATLRPAANDAAATAGQRRSKRLPDPNKPPRNWFVTRAHKQLSALNLMSLQLVSPACVCCFFT